MHRDSQNIYLCNVKFVSGFPNVEIAVGIFRSVLVTDASGEGLFTKLNL
jgi:hypothetical protein